MKLPKHWPIRLISLALSFIFALFAALQLNDQNPLTWFALYGLASVMAALAFFKYYNLPLRIAVAVFYFGVLLYIFPPSVEVWLNAEQQAQSFDMALPFQEQGREAAGMLICLIASVFHIWAYYKINR